MRKGIILIGLLSFIGCHTASDSGNLNPNITYIRPNDLREISTFNVTLFLDSCSYIPLETSDNLLIGRVEQLEISNQYIFFINSNDSLYVFDRQGHFLNTVGTKGRGPREYVSIHSYTMTPACDTVIIFDHSKLSFYTRDNRFIRTINLDKYVRDKTHPNRSINSIFHVQPGKLLLKYDITDKDNIFYSIFDYYNHSLKNIATLPVSFQMEAPDCRVNLSFFKVSRWQETITCPILYNDTLFQYISGSLTPRFVVNALKEKMVPDKLLRQQNGKILSEVFQSIIKSGLFIRNIDESENYFFIIYNGKEPLELIWNKHSHKGLLIKLNPEFNGHTFAPMAVSPLAILNEDKNFFDNNGNRYYPDPRGIIPIKSQLQEDDNPVIVLYHLKPTLKL